VKNQVENSDAFNITMADMLAAISKILKESMSAVRPVSSASIRDRLKRLTFKEVKKTASYYLVSQLEMDGFGELENDINKFINSMHTDGRLLPSLRQGMIEALDKLVLELNESEEEPDPKIS
jgi:hypothetical protein